MASSMYKIGNGEMSLFHYPLKIRLRESLSAQSDCTSCCLERVLAFQKEKTLHIMHREFD